MNRAVRRDPYGRCVDCAAALGEPHTDDCETVPWHHPTEEPTP